MEPNDPLPQSPFNAPPASPNRTWEVLCHLSALSGYLFLPLGWILGPLIIWLIKRNENPAVDYHGKESLNFQISMLIYALIAGLLIFVCIGGVILGALVIANIVLVIIASIKASNGEYYRYPLTIRFIT
ncbi:MAG: DUF4870 domain-containing protein [Verrucomicrobiota bacterium]